MPRLYKPLNGSRCTATFIFVFVVPMLFVALHSYTPLSAGLKLFIVRLPPLIVVFPAGKGIPSLVQFMEGRGNPLAWHVSFNVEYSFGVMTDGGGEIKMGRPTWKKKIEENILHVWLEKTVIDEPLQRIIYSGSPETS